jgi:hypothetical protein
MTVNLSALAGAGQQFFDDNGTPLAGGKLYSYVAGTTTPQATYTSVNGATPHANPIILNSAGRVATGEIWLTAGSNYKFVLLTSANVTLVTWDNITGINGTGIATAAANVSFTGFKAQSGTVADLADNDGSDWIGFKPAGVNSVARSAQDKMRDFVSVKDFGAVGDGVTNDTVAIQLALSSGAKNIEFTPATYLIDGGLTLTAANTTLICTGATIKLKNSASSLAMLFITGADCTVDGGTWDGNKANGNKGDGSILTTYSSFNIAMYADRCTVKNINSVNTFGMAIKGVGNYLSALNNRINNTEHYGIFFDGDPLASNTGNRAIGNTIDMSEGKINAGENIGQGILFTGFAGLFQTNWELSNNNIIGPQTSVQDQAINLGVRGSNGIVSNNSTRYGAMGFSEGGANTVINGNRFLDLVGAVRYGIELSGGAGVISNNVVTNALRGVIASGNINFDGLTITGNHLEAGTTGLGVNLQIGATGSGKNIVISGNYLKGSTGINTSRDVTNLTISGNVIVGPSPTFASGRGIFIDTPVSNVYVFITGNTIVDVQRPYSIYSVAATTFNYLFATNNNLSLAGSNINSSAWSVEGAAVIGTAVVSANNINPATIGLEYSVVNQLSNIRIQYGTATPEASITAGIGSLFINKSGGAGTTLYVKQTGTGNTGWAGLS